MTRVNGIIRTLVRERHPFAVLAILAALLPTLLAGTGVFGGVRLADGSLVICTNDGFVRVADKNQTGRHDPNDCCKSGCIHAFAKMAIGPAPVVQPVRFVLSTGISWPPAAVPVRDGGIAVAPGIRAPPAAPV